MKKVSLNGIHSLNLKMKLVKKKSDKLTICNTCNTRLFNEEKCSSLKVYYMYTLIIKKLHKVYIDFFRPKKVLKKFPNKMLHLSRPVNLRGRLRTQIKMMSSVIEFVDFNKFCFLPHL